MTDISTHQLFYPALGRKCCIWASSSCGCAQPAVPKRARVRLTLQPKPYSHRAAGCHWHTAMRKHGQHPEWHSFINVETTFCYVSFCFSGSLHYLSQMHEKIVRWRLLSDIFCLSFCINKIAIRNKQLSQVVLIMVSFKEGCLSAILYLCWFGLNAF